MATVLVVDDDRSVEAIIRGALQNVAADVEVVTSAEEAWKYLQAQTPDVILLDYVLPQMSGLDFLGQLHRDFPRLPVIFMTAQGTSDTTIAATKAGVHDYLLKPLDLDAVEESVRKALDGATSLPPGDVCGEHIVPRDHGDAFVGRSSATQAVLKSIGRVAAQDVTVLIRGESGTGKELVAQAIWRHSGRCENLYLAVNCAALSESLLESELFGHEKGAFTGATTQHVGKFEQCSGGTIFLDEIGDMAISVQAKVLRLLQEQEFERVGGNKTISTDVRIIAATNRDLEAMCESGEFRSDLFHRLNGYTIFVPPLSERQGDIDLLLEHFLAKYNQRLTKNIDGISPDAAEALREYKWPGNVRELQTVLSKAMLDAPSGVITRDLLSEAVRSDASANQPPSSPSPQPDPDAPRNGSDVALERRNGAGIEQYVAQLLDASPEDLHATAIRSLERALLVGVLNRAAGNRTHAARMLGITRSSLRNKMKALGITVDKSAVFVNEEL